MKIYDSQLLSDKKIDLYLSLYSKQIKRKVYPRKSPEMLELKATVNYLLTLRKEPIRFVSDEIFELMVSLFDYKQQRASYEYVSVYNPQYTTSWEVEGHWVDSYTRNDGTYVEGHWRKGHVRSR